MYIVCICVYVCVCIYVHLHKHTHTNTRIYTYIIENMKYPSFFSALSHSCETELRFHKINNYKFCQICKLTALQSFLYVSTTAVDFNTQKSSKTFQQNAHVIFVQYHF